MSFYDHVLQNHTEIGPLCAGLDPHPQLIASWDLPINARGLEEFVARCVEAYIPTVGIVKPQVALFEAFGSAGFCVLESAINTLSEAGIVVIADAKRGDIGSTMRGYGQAWFDHTQSDLASDALTVSPYLGEESLETIVSMAKSYDKGVFVLAKTSNPGAQLFQDAQIETHISLSQSIVNWASNYNIHCESPIAHLVIGATKEHTLDLHNFHGCILIPGLGFQGAKSEDIKYIFRDSWNKHLLIPTMSRTLLTAGPSVSVLSSTIMGYNRELRMIVHKNT